MTLAHQGGWDEILLVAAPILLFAVLLWFANKRAAAQLDAEQTVAEANAAEPPTQD
jgi:hypothetical protein